MIEVGVEPPAVNAAISIPMIPVKPAEAVERKPVTSEVEPSEAAEMEATKSVESTEVETAEMASSEVTTAEMATTGIRDLGQRNRSRNERCGHERDKLTIHDTLLLDGDLLAATEVLEKWRSCGFFSRIYRSRSIAVPTSTACAARWCPR